MSMLLALALTLGAPPASAAPTPDTQKFQVHISGRRVGVAEWRWGNLDGQESYVEILWMRVAQRGGQADLSHHYELERAPGSDVLNFQRQFVAGPATQFQQGRIVDGRVRLERSSSGATGPVASLPVGVVMPYLLMKRLREAARSQWPSDDFMLFDMDILGAVPARASGCPLEKRVATLDCVHLSTLGGNPRNEDWFFDSKGQLQRVDGRFAGLPSSLLRCEGGCGQAVDQPFDLVGQMVVDSPFHIPESAAQQRLRFLIAREDGERPVLAETGDQEVAFDGNKAVVTVCRNCMASAPETTESLAPYLRPNRWVQSDAPEFRRLAKRVGGADEGVDGRMRRSVSLLLQTLASETGYIGYTDALQTLRRKRGDCMGFAVVLAALARAQGIPARVVYGMAYTDRFSGKRDVFSPHAWVQAWDGQRWLSYDAALRDFDSTHIALAVGTGRPDEVGASFLQLTQLRVERAGIVSAP